MNPLSFLGGLLPLAFGLFHYFSLLSIPGDLGDARFNLYVLEHGFRWLSGLDASFWSAPFFFPARDVIAYSDNLLGSLPIYVLFREIGKDRETAYQFWVMAGFTLNYLSCLWVLRKWSLSWAGAVSGSYLFTFGLPVMAQAGMHLQLIPRFMVPLALFFWIKFIKNPCLNSFSISLGALLWQIYIGIYTGYFLGLFMGASWLSFWLFEKGVLERVRKKKMAFFEGGSFSVLARTRRLISVFFLRKYRPYWIVVGFFVGGLLPLAIPYTMATRSVGTRSWEEIAAMLPRVQSYFRDPESLAYGKIMTFGSELPLPWEHMLFLGWVPLIALCLFPLMRRDKKASSGEVFRIFFGSVIMVFAMTLDVGGWSLYWVVAHLPGANAIRSVTRVVVVMLFPIGAILGHCMTRVEDLLRNTEHGLKTPLQKGVPLLALLIAVPLVSADQLSEMASFNKRASQERIAFLTSKILDVSREEGISLKGALRPILWVNQGDGAAFETQIDAMLASQNLGISTVNGYSGNLPAGYGGNLFSLARGQCRDWAQWVDHYRSEFSGKKILVLGRRCS